jgi:hypothetical protein
LLRENNTEGLNPNAVEGDYFLVVLPRQEWVNVCCLSPFLLKMSISAVVTARNHDILRLQPQESVFLYFMHLLIKSAMSVKTKT